MRGVVLLLVAWAGVAGCRHLPPDLKPAKQKEVFVKPPPGDRRYDYPIYPKEAFNEKYDPRKNSDIAGSGPGQGSPKGPGMMPVGGPGGGPGY